MIRAFCLLLALSPALVSTEWAADDTAAVRELLDTINRGLHRHDPDLLSTVVASDAEVWAWRSCPATGRRALDALLPAERPWTETTRPQLRRPNIRFLTRAAVLITAELVQYGSLIGKRSVPVVLAAKKASGGWRLSFLGILASLPPPALTAAGAAPCERIPPTAHRSLSGKECRCG